MTNRRLYPAWGRWAIVILLVFLLWGAFRRKKNFLLSLLFPQPMKTLSIFFPMPKVLRRFQVPILITRHLGTAPEPVGIAFRTGKIVPEIRGYAGPVDILVGMDPQGNILGLKIMDHHETPSYFRPFLEDDFPFRFKKYVLQEFF